ncbi:MAG: Asp-tRNA(Asn)/Glu-tRNA(Gln) amidotransferase subunit GatC [Candidatus Levybacteria bacterium]|nr:Asp-tRNA(Asn)/Glu-tRNA(Gln) amidotransferase subunit GatC [Candidatus Levybacteria bacterium]
MKQPSTPVTIDIKRVAQLASLPITPEEEKKLGKELTETLDYIAVLNAIDTTDVPPTSQVTGLTNVLREDTALPSLSQEQALQNNTETDNGFFKVPAILEQ